MNKLKPIVIFLIIATGVHASVIQGTRMDVDWEKLISGQDIILTLPPVDAKYGLLLGNGDVGVSVYGPPECLTLHIGKNDIWDYRDGVYEKIKTETPITQRQIMELFADPNKSDLEVYEELKKLGKPWEDVKAKGHNPKIAGQIRFVNKALEGKKTAQRLHLYDAEVTGTLGQVGTQVFVPYNRNLIVATYSPNGKQKFDIELARNKAWPWQEDKGIEGPKFGTSGNDLWVRYKFPADEMSYAYKDGFEYAMYVRIIGDEAIIEEKKEGLTVAHLDTSKPITLFVGIATSRDAKDPFAAAKKEVEKAVKARFSKILKEHRNYWHDFWERSFFQIPENRFMTRLWFLSNYHTASCSKPGKTTPGLFGPWVKDDFCGWYGSYTWDYNVRQTFWGAHSSNHLEQAISLTDTIFDLLPGCKREAKEIYELEGAVYPIVSWPGVTDYNPYVFSLYHLSKCMSLTGWAAQDMWLYYQYSQDKSFLREKGYPVMKECAIFYEGFLTKATDGKYDIVPTISPEHWNLSRTFKYNKNCTADLSLIRYLMKSCIKASEILKVDKQKRAIWDHIAENLREYPTAEAPDGKVFVDVENAPFPFRIYNVPVPLMAIFPSSDIGLHSSEEVKDTAERTAKYINLNLTNALVMTSMAKVRLGQNVLDNEFEKYARWLWRSNGTLYLESLLSDVWLECFGLPIVFNESALQSYTGYLRIAPVKLDKTIRFNNLRTEGAFLVSSEIKPGGRISYITILSETGKSCKLFRPWEGTVRIRTAKKMKEVRFSESDSIISFATKKGGTYIVDNPANPWEKQPITNVSASEAKPQPVQWQLFYTHVPFFNPDPYSFVYTPEKGATLHTLTNFTTWQLQLAPIESSKYKSLEAFVIGDPNAEIALEVKDVGGNQIAKLDYQKCSTEEQKFELKIPQDKFIGAIAISIQSFDKKRVEFQLRSLKLVADDGSEIEVDLSAIDIYKGSQKNFVTIH